MKRHLMLIIFLLLNILNGNAQKISGKVIDGETKESLPYVGLKVFTDSKFYNEYTTDEQGSFSLEIPLKTFTIDFSMLGYTPNSIKIENADKQSISLGNIILEEDIKVLNEVSITANSIIKTIGKDIIYPSKQALNSSDGGLSLLKNLNLEGLLVDIVNESVSTNLASSIIYKIDGITSSLQQIKSLQPENILRIEYNSTATARYANEDAAVINVILKKAQVGTSAGTDFSTAVTTGFINGMTYFTSVYGKSKFFLDYNIGWRDYKKPWGNIDTEYRYPTDTVRQYKKYKNQPFHYILQNVDFGYVYNGEKDVFSANMIIGILTSGRQDNYDIYNDQIQSIDILRNSTAKDNQLTPSLDLFYKHSFEKNNGLEFNIVGTLMNSNIESELIDTYTKENDKKEYVYQDTEGRKKSLIIEGLYYNKKENFGFSTGARGMYSYSKNIYIYNNIDRLKLIDIYPYAEIEGMIKNVNYTISSGVKILHMDNFTNSKKYFRNLSTFSLFYRKNSIWNLRYSFRYNPEYPSLGSMSNIDQVVDSIMVVRGNPNIKPAQNLDNLLQLTVSEKKLTMYTSIFAKKTFDAIQTDIFYDGAVHSMVRHSDNHPYSSSYGINLQANINSLLDIFTIQTGTGWTEYKTKINGRYFSFNQWRWFLHGSAQINKFTVSAGYNSPNKSMYGQTIFLNENYSQVSVMYKKGDLSLKASIMWPFTSGTKYGTERLSEVAPEKSVRYIKDNKNMVTLGLRYNINWGKSIFNINKKLENTDRDRGVLDLN